MSVGYYYQLARKHQHDDCPILSNIGFVIRQAERYARHSGEVEDYIQDGIEGLVMADKKFNKESGNTFLTFAGFYVTERMRRSQARMWDGVAIKYNMYCGRNRPDRFPEVHIDPDSVFNQLCLTPNYDQQIQLAEVENALKVISKSSPRKAEVFAQIIESDGNAAEVARSLGSTPRSIRERLYECRNLIKAKVKYDSDYI